MRGVTRAAALAVVLAAAGGGAAARAEGMDVERQREAMVREQIEARGVRDPRVLAALRAVPRERFVAPALRQRAYDDGPLPIGEGQTISQPYIVAVMTEALRPEAGDRVLEVGTGSGYQAAVLARLVARVYTIELLPPLARRARALLSELGVANVEVFEGDGYLGLPQHAPFDGILLTAAPPEVPAALLAQLAVGGRLVAPVGESEQQLRVLEKTPAGMVSETLFPVRFVPMVPGKRDEPARPLPPPGERVQPSD
jgi:protein-L-isoaspartate(D-aspartate) O-methyltransferase